MTFKLICKDVIEALQPLPPNIFHGCLCDPPYGLKFMGKKWDHGVPGVPYWSEVFRVLKPGAYILAFGGTRTYHRLACAIEDAGFEIFDSVLGSVWLYGQGFPKSMDIGKAIDKCNGDALAWRRFSEAYKAAVESSSLSHADIDRELGIKSSSCYWARSDHRGGMPPRRHWNKVKALLGLSPHFEVLYLSAEREITRPGKAKGKSRGIYGDFTEDEYNYTAPSTDAACLWNGYGTALKPAWEPVVCARKPLDGTYAANCMEHGVGGLNIDGCRIDGKPRTTHADGNRVTCESSTEHLKGKHVHGPVPGAEGRFPSNVILSHHPECEDTCSPDCPVFRLDQQNDVGASKFFYQAKCSPAERKAGLSPESTNRHPTLKAVSLTAYLAKLILPPTPTPRLLVPFCGTGSEIAGALRSGWSHVVGIDNDQDSISVAESRIPGLLFLK